MTRRGRGTTGSSRSSSAHLDRIDPATPPLPAARILLAVVHGRAGRYREAERSSASPRPCPAATRRACAEFVRVSRSCWIDHRQARTPSALAATDKALAALEADESRDPTDATCPTPTSSGPSCCTTSGASTTRSRRSTGPTRPRPAGGSGRCSRRLVSLWRARALAQPGALERPRAGAGPGRPRRAARHRPPAPAPLPRVARRAGRHTTAARSAAPPSSSSRGPRLAGDQDAYTTALVRCDLVAALTGIGLGDEARRELSAARAEAKAVRAPRAVARGELLAAALAGTTRPRRGPLVLTLASTRRYGLDDLWTRVERRRAGAPAGSGPGVRQRLRRGGRATCWRPAAARCWPRRWPA